MDMNKHGFHCHILYQSVVHTNLQKAKPMKSPSWKWDFLGIPLVKDHPTAHGKFGGSAMGITSENRDLITKRPGRTDWLVGYYLQLSGMVLPVGPSNIQ